MQTRQRLVGSQKRKCFFYVAQGKKLSYCPQPTTSADNVKKNPLGKKLSSNSKFHALKTYLLRAEWIIWMFLLIFWLRHSSGGCRMIQSITPSVYIQRSLCFSLPRQRLCLVIKRCGVNVTPLLCGCRSSDWHRNSPAVHEDSKNVQSLLEITQREKEKKMRKL